VVEVRVPTTEQRPKAWPAAVAGDTKAAEAVWAAHHRGAGAEELLAWYRSISLLLKRANPTEYHLTAECQRRPAAMGAFLRAPGGILRSMGVERAKSMSGEWKMK
jgi:hypothetical protein